MTISAADITKLRESTGAGMMDCKKALEEAEGDTDKAAEILRKKGIVKAAKRTDKIAAEGLTLVKEEGNMAAIVEVNSETDFVAKSDDFKQLVSTVVDTLIKNNPVSAEEAMGQTVAGGSDNLQDYFNATVAKIGEKINLRRFAVKEKGAGEIFGTYVHMGGKISVLVWLKNSDNAELARDIAMHIAAANPRYLNRESVDPDEVNKEKEISSEQLRAQNKPENIIENIVKGKMDKFYSEVCLLEQPYIKDEEKKILQLLTEAGDGVEIIEFIRYELGEGLEKKSCDFAAEVAEQMK